MQRNNAIVAATLTAASAVCLAFAVANKDWFYWMAIPAYYGFVGVYILLNDPTLLEA